MIEEKGPRLKASKREGRHEETQGRKRKRRNIEKVESRKGPCSSDDATNANLTFPFARKKLRR